MLLSTQKRKSKKMQKGARKNERKEERKEGMVTKRERQTQIAGKKEGGRERRLRLTIFHVLVHFPNGHAGLAGSAQVRMQEFDVSLPCVCRAPSTWSFLCCFPRHYSKELDWKWSSRDLRAFGMLALQILASIVVSQCEIPTIKFFLFSYSDEWKIYIFS